MGLRPPFPALSSFLSDVLSVAVSANWCEALMGLKENAPSGQAQGANSERIFINLNLSFLASSGIFEKPRALCRRPFRLMLEDAGRQRL